MKTIFIILFLRLVTVKNKDIKRKIFKIIYEAPNESLESTIFDSVIIGLIILSVVILIAESFEKVYAQYGFYLGIFECIIALIFTVEYLFRLWTSDFLYKDDRKIAARIKFIFSPIAIIDLLAILPFYLFLFLPIDLRYLRILRLIRVIRIFKLNRYTNTISLFANVFKSKKDELIVTFTIAFLIILIASILMYNLEYNVQPEAFPNIISTFWWAVVTLTTVGYGDVYPVTTGGKLLGGFISLLGIGLVALPTGIIGSGFIQEMANLEPEAGKVIEDKDSKYCPHCGKKINE